MFIIGQEYTKWNIYDILNVPIEKQRGAWDKGSHFYNNLFFIFANVGVAGRTQNDYPNKWIDEGFEWYGQRKSSVNQPMIQKLISGNFPVHIFTREDNVKPFKYEGEGSVFRYENVVRVKIIWIINSDKSLKKIILEANEENSFVEGAKRFIGINKYERNAKARQECIKYFGYKCQICGFDFKKVYGEIGLNYIHVHHITPVSSNKKEHFVNSVKDLIPICPNCHAMIHTQTPPLSIEELKSMIKFN